jgi:hypothetical protein
MSLLPAAHLSQKLTQPLPIKSGTVLRTIRCAADYMLTLPHGHVEANNGWRHAATLILEQTDVATVSHQLHRALFLEAKLDLGAMR